MQNDTIPASPVRMFTINARRLFLAALALNTSAAFAQDSGLNELEILLSIAGTFTDNFYYEDTVERSVAGAVLKPVVEYSRSSNAIDFGLTAQGEMAGYSFGRRDNYADGLGSASINFKLPAQTTLGFTGIGQYDHDPFGTERTEGQPSVLEDLDKWAQWSGTVALVGGNAEKSKLGYELKYTALKREYQTNTQNTRFLDRQLDTGSATLLFHFSPKLSMLGQVLAYDVAFDNVKFGTIDRSAEALVGMIGLKWAATAKTSGDIRFGQGEWTPDEASSLQNSDTSYWQSSLSWAPSRKTTFNATAGRQYLPTYRFDAVYLDDRNVGLEWRQLWTYRASTRLSLSSSKRDFVGIAEKHDYINIQFKYDYQLDREVRVFLTYRYLERDAVTDSQDFTTNGASIGLEAKFN